MPFEAESGDRGERFHNQGTISSDGLGRTDSPWANIGDFYATYPFPAFVPPFEAERATTTPAVSTALAGGGGSAGSVTASDAVQPLPGVQTQSGNTGFVIVPVFDTSITTLEASNLTLYNEITGAITSAIDFYETAITTSMTIEIKFGDGEISGGTAIKSGAVSESIPQEAGGIIALGTPYVDPSYGTLVSKMEKVDPSLTLDLPGTDPISSGEFALVESEAVALGLLKINNGATEFAGYIGLTNDPSLPLDFNPSDRNVAGNYDAIGALEHEISELMGRTDILGTTSNNGTLNYTPMDLLRFNGAGSHDLTAGGGSYISLDGGTTGATAGALNNSVQNSGDPGDWASSVTNDSYDAGATIGVANTVSAFDLSLMHALGYTLASACYAAGTRIRSARGDVPVEDLAIGELVHTRFAGLAPIKWMGHRRIDCRRHPDPEQVWPIRIVADAFAPGQPQRDLLLSPDHAVAVDDVLIPIRVLVNGASIRQESEWPRIHYFHVELDRHDLLIAEGLEAESYLDTGNRGMFANADTALILHPRFNAIGTQAGRAARSCLPLTIKPEQVLPAWRALATRAESLGFAIAIAEATTTADPDLCILAGSRRFVPVIGDSGLYSFVLPALTDDIRLRSRSTSPAAACPWLHDRRRLGVRVRQISLRTAGGHVEIALDDPRLTDGWWAVERDGAVMRRWTNGDALLPRVEGPAIVELLIGDTLAYPIDEAIVPAARAA